MRNAAIDTVIANGLSIERLGKYLLASGGDLHPALALYERNTRLSEAFYTSLQILEIALRNRLDQQLRRVYGQRWCDGGPPFATDAIQRIDEAIRDLGRSRTPITPGAVVAELSFGFWVSLLGPRYDATLWRQALHRGFHESGRGMRRDRVHGRFNAIRRFRNRIAHHEPIFLNDLQARHAEIIEAIGWMCPQTSAWALHQSRLPAVLRGP